MTLRSVTITGAVLVALLALFLVGAAQARAALKPGYTPRPAPTPVVTRIPAAQQRLAKPAYTPRPAPTAVISRTAPVAVR